MCKVGDIILVNSYKDNGKNLSRHSFVVISDEEGKIQGCSYDFICNVLSSFKNEEQKKRKLNYPGNFPIAHDDTVTDPHNDKDGYIKMDQWYYFNKDKLDYTVIGSVKQDIFDLLIEFLEDSKSDLYDIIDNL